MAIRKSALRGPAAAGHLIYEVHAFIPSDGFRAAFYTAESQEQALELFKREYPTGRAFWIQPTRGRAISGPPAVKYRAWWKDLAGNWAPHMVFLFDAQDNLIGSVPEFPESMTQQFWLHALSRVGRPNHKLEEVSQSNASLLANEILGAQAMQQEEILRKWNEGKLDDAGAEDLPDIDWSELEDPEKGPNLGAIEEVDKPEMWDLEAVKRAVESGFTFGLPFILRESLFTPNAYWIGGHQYAAGLLTVGPEHTPELAMLSDGWLRVKLFFPQQMVPKKTWVEPPNRDGVVSVYAEIDPETVDWDQLNRGKQIRVPKGLL